MIGLRIGAAELDEIEAGAPALVAAPELELPELRPLVVLVPREGVLARPGTQPARSLPLPPDLPLLGLLAGEEAAAALLPLLPAGLPLLTDPALLPGLLAEALRTARAAHAAAEGESRRLLRALGAAPPRPVLALDLPPIGAAATAPPASLRLARPAAGICTVELHLAMPGSGGLHVRLLAGARVVGSWRVPAAARRPGWLALDLPEPAPDAPEEAVLEVSTDAAEAPPLLSLVADRSQAGLALRLWTTGPGWSVLPRHFDWAAMGATRPALPLPLPAALLAEAVPEGARAELVGVGEESPRLVLEIPAGGEMLLRLPALPVGPADLLRLRLLRPIGAEAGMEAALAVERADAEAGTGWRPIGARAELALPLPDGGMAAPRLALRHRGKRPALVEVESLALVAGAAGETRVAPPAELAAGRGRYAVAMPFGAALPPWRSAPPAPQPPLAVPGGATRAALALPRTAAGPVPPRMPSAASGFQELRLNQHLDNAGSGYRHLDVGISGLVSAAGLWRQVRLKLFERRGVAGLEFRQAKGWPPMFDVWPEGGSDAYGPFWRLETEVTGLALAALTTPHDRALVAALMDVLPEIAGQASRAARLEGAEAEPWIGLARRMVEAVGVARGTIRPT
jgi:hypothetical protein